MRRLALVAVLSFCATPVLSQFRADCSDAPSDNLKQVCRRLRQSDQQARENFDRQAETGVWPPQMPGSPVWLQPEPVPAGSRGQIATHPYDCMTLICLCPFFGGGMAPDGVCMLPNGLPLTMAYRKELRMMTDDERLRYLNAMTVLKQSGEYDRLSAEHRDVGTGSGAHSGPGFLPWHREYLKRFEIALRLIDPTVFVPYWDSVMDGYLDDPRDSVLFTNDFIGETDPYGNVIYGPFAYWRTLEGRPYIQRNLGAEGHLFTETELNQVMLQTNVEYVMAYTVPEAGCPYPINFAALEYTHANIHLFIGGDLKPPTTSANDPIFYNHHSFVDLIWETWRQLRQPKWVREAAYPPDMQQCDAPLHFSYATMVPFYNLANRDGLSNLYTDQMYKYASRPSCSVEFPTCGSKYLFCDTRGYPHCVAKVKLGGLCMRYMGFDACYNGQCIFGRCVYGPTPAPFRPPTTTTPVPPRPAPAARAVRPRAPASVRNTTATVRPRIFVDCFNRNPCCESWAAQGECKNNGEYMKAYCRPACGFCEPSFNKTNECANRHVSCTQWQSEGQCTGNSKQFMQENCRSSCSLCGTPKATTCEPIKPNQQRTRPKHVKSAKNATSKPPTTPFVQRMVL